MEDIIARIVKESQRVKEDFIRKNTSILIDLAEYISKAFKNDKKLMLCGNGGSAADAQHIAAEFVNRFQLDRHPLPAMALTTDTSIITSVANDYGYEEVFSKQIQALGVEGDILLAISTSGNSKNILSAIRTAKEKHLYTVGLIGGDGGEMVTLVDLSLVVKSNQTPRVQEAHILTGHIICELVEYILFQKNS
ncbi:MAG: SIS domain-containing protein [Desulfobacteraceae bacterium]|nr:MAG: SIS domain-containing protein [Desulfobacteraceae bacterium]